MRSSYRIPVHYVMLVIHSGPGLPLLIYPASGIQGLLYTCNIIPLLEKMLEDTLSHTDNYYMTPICSLFRKASFISWEINQASISWVTPISVKAVYQNFDTGSTSDVLAIYKIQNTHRNNVNTVLHKCVEHGKCCYRIVQIRDCHL